MREEGEEEGEEEERGRGMRGGWKKRRRREGGGGYFIVGAIIGFVTTVVTVVVQDKKHVSNRPQFLSTQAPYQNLFIRERSRGLPVEMLCTSLNQQNMDNTRKQRSQCSAPPPLISHIPKMGE